MTRDANQKDLDPAAELLRPSGTAIPVIGAGVAQSAGLPGSAGLAMALLAQCDESSMYNGAPEHLAGVVDHLVTAGHEEADLLNIAAAEVATWVPRQSELIATLVHVPSRFIITLNFDSSLEEAATKAGAEPVVLGNGREDLATAIGIAISGTPPERLTILHLHGRAEQPSSMVLGAGGYKRIEAEPFNQLLRELAVHKTLFFFGTKLDEFYILAGLQQIEHRNSHVLWCLESEKAELTNARSPILHSSSGIYVRTVRYYEDLPAKAALLLHEPLPSEEPEFVPTDETEPLYVANELKDRRDPTDPDDLVRASFDLEPEREIRPDPTEDDVRQASRTIVLGDPGTGKTELLRSLMRHTKPPRYGLFIRLAEVEIESELGPRETLAQWARHGVSAQPGLDVSPAALEERGFHFFLDGLDEVAIESQEQLAKGIAELAQELPRHAFTVSTRPLPSLDLLQIESPEALDWNQFTLEPGVEWRDRFLAAREVSLDALYDEMPALEDMADVLTTPFYLSSIVDLHEEDGLKGLRDFGQVLGRLIDSAISREQGVLGLENDEIRTWLQKVAVAAVISGRRTLSADELRCFDLPPGSRADPVELARAMEQRLLLAEDRGSFRFHHRLLGEQLAAEALVASGSPPELLDCLVPYIDEGLSGVRPDAVVPIGLACLRSEDWRRPVAERDPLAAARATPSDAASTELEAALRVLWENAATQQIWVWERGMQLTDDAEAMGRLIRAIPSSAVATQVRAAVHSGTDQDQGNAIRVLSRAGADGLENLLKKVLADSARNGVVLRQAAIAAGDRGFMDLADDIVEMLLRHDDRAIHQDGLIGLRRLLRDQHRMDLYFRLMAGHEADYLVAVVLDELEPRDSVELLAEYLRQGNEGDSFWARKKVPPLFSRLDLADASSNLLEAAVDVAVLFHLEGEALDPLRLADRRAVIARLATLTSEHDLGWWQVMNLALLFEPDELAVAGLPERVVRSVAVRREADAAGAAGNAPPVPQEDEEEEEQQPPTLGGLLDKADTDVLILNNSQYFAEQIEDLSEGQKSELRDRLARWWPPKPLRETITWTSPNSWQQEAKSAAWIWLGPSARPELSPDQWAELATCGILFEEQRKWLMESQTTEGIYKSIELLNGNGPVDHWEQFLSCCSNPVPNPALVACARSLDPWAAADSQGMPYRLRTIAGRLLENGRVDLAREIADRHEPFAEELSPLLAAEGDLDAQRQMLDAVINGLENEKLPDDPRLSWLVGARSPKLLGRLFQIVRIGYKVSDRTNRRSVTVGYDIDDVVRPAIDAIAAIGGRRAVAEYDGLLSTGGDFRWLAHQRSQLGQALLAADGERFAAAAATRLSIPLLDGAG